MFYQKLQMHLFGDKTARSQDKKVGLKGNNFVAKQAVRDARLLVHSFSQSVNHYVYSNRRQSGQLNRSGSRRNTNTSTTQPMPKTLLAVSSIYTSSQAFEARSLLDYSRSTTLFWIALVRCINYYVLQTGADLVFSPSFPFPFLLLLIHLLLSLDNPQ